MIAGWVALKEGYCRAKLEVGANGRSHIPKFDRMHAPHVMPDNWGGGWVALDGSPEARPFTNRLVEGVVFPTAEAAMVAAEVELANRQP